MKHREGPRNSVCPSCGNRHVGAYINRTVSLTKAGYLALATMRARENYDRLTLAERLELARAS